MKEFFEKRRLTGTINLTLSNKEKWAIDKAYLCRQAVKIIESYSRKGYLLTLRQLYYQLVSGDVIRNDDVVYKKLSGVLDDLRYSAGVDWEEIEDRGRVPYLPWWTDGIAEALDTIVRQYRLDRQEGQPVSIEVWTEKDAISGILKRVTSKFHIRLVVNKGYSSSSAMYAAYKRFAEKIAAGIKVKILYFGDHDPSGLDMLRDIKERILFFLSRGVLKNNDEFRVRLQDWWDEQGYTVYDVAYSDFAPENLIELWKNGDSDFDDLFDIAQVSMYLNDTGAFEIEPIGLTMEQIKQYNPPPNPAKIKDPRAAWYIKKFGPVSYEVDALPPEVMTEIVNDKVVENLDKEIYDAVVKREKEQAEIIKAFAETYRTDNSNSE